MVQLPLAFLLALTVRPEGALLRAGCSQDDAGIVRLAAGAAVTIKFALTGETGLCYKVSVVAGGKVVEGYLPGSALTNIGEFDRLRRTARQVEIPDTLVAPAARGPAAAPLKDAVELIRRNQPGEALEILEKQLAAHPKDPQLLALAGFAAYQTDDAARAADYWRQSLDLHPDPQIEQIYRKLRREMDADGSRRKSYGSRFLVRYDDNQVPADLARAMVDALEQEYSRISNELGCGAQERIPVVVQSREAYLKTTEAASWSAGQYDGRIHVALSEGNTIGPETRRTFAHELVHACLASLPGVPAWLNEGLAQRLSGEGQAPGRGRQLEAMIAGAKPPALASLYKPWPQLDSEAAVAAYAVSLKAVNLIYDEYSFYGIRTVVRNPDLMRKLAVELDRRMGL